MKIAARSSCLSLIVITALVDAIQPDQNDPSPSDIRQGRVSGRIVKLYSGPKPDPVLCFEEGFKADPVQCSLFYRCVKSSPTKFSIFKFQCGPGTVFDPETEVCNHPKNTKRVECGGIILPLDSDSENELDLHEIPSPISTLLPIYMSHTGSANSTSIAPELLTSMSFNEPTQTSSQTIPVSPYFPETTTNSYSANNIIGLYPMSNNNSAAQQNVNLLNTNFSILEKSEPCTSDGFMADSVNCKKFYRCVSNSRGGFVRYEFLCSDPTVWDNELQSCNHPWAVRNKRCGTTSHALSGTTNNNDWASQTVSSQIPQINNNNEIQQTQRPTHDQIDYYNELNDQDQIKYGYTVKPIKIHTEDKSIKTTIQDSFDANFGHRTSLPIHLATNKTEEQFLFTKDNSDYICTQSGFVRDDVDCKKFYRCVDNGKGRFMKYEFSCSEGTVWDRNLEACNYAWAVKDCGNITKIESTTTVTTVTPTYSAAILTTSDENIDNSYLNQINQGIELATIKPVSTTVSLVSQTQSSNLVGSKCTVTGFIGDTTNCKKFYRCVDTGRGTFTRYEYQCGEGTLWDQNIEACNHAWAVTSCNQNLLSNYVSTTTTETTGIFTISPLIQSTTSENSQNLDYETAYNSQESMATVKPDLPDERRTTTQIMDNRNHCLSTGFIGDTKNCEKFYRCVDNGQGGYIRHEFTCGEGTVWDPSIEACNHAWAVKQCGGSVPDKELTTTINNTHMQNQYTTKLNDGNVITTTATILSSTSEKIDEYDSYYNQQQIKTTIKPNTNITTTTFNEILVQKNDCQYDGFIGDVHDCKKFYRCVNDGNNGFNRYEFACGDGTVWDPEIEACNHAWAVEKCGGNIPSEGVGTVSSSTNMYVEEINSEYISENYVDTQNSTPLIDIQSTSVSHLNENNECVSDGFMSDKHDCKKFYRCVDNGNGTYLKYSFSCGDGTVWDTKINACNHASVVDNCRDNSMNIISETSEIPSSSPVNEIINGAYTTQSFKETQSTTLQSIATSVGTISAINFPTSTVHTTEGNDFTSHIKEECRSEGFFANSYDCKKFYRCVANGNGEFTKYDFTCVDGTVWVQEIQACDYDTDVNCSLSSVSPPTGSSNNLSELTTTSTILSTDVITNESQSDKGVTNDKVTNDACISEGFYPNKYNCQYFYRCVSNEDGSYTKFDFSCSEGTAWDDRTQSCNHINEVKSCSTDRPTESNLYTTTTAMQDGQVTELENESMTQVTASVSTVVGSEPSQHNECQEEGYFGNVDDCKKFYRCVSDDKEKYTKFDFTCGDGTIWDQDIIACNHPYDVKNPSCISKPEGTVSSVMSSTTSTITEANKSTTAFTTGKPLSTPSTTTSNNTDTTTNCSNNGSTQSISHNSYKCSKAGFYADPYNCKKFYRCVDWENNGEKFSIYHYECGDGTIWDPALETCNHESSIYPPRFCNGTHEQNQNATEISSTTEETLSTTNGGELSSTINESTKTTAQQTTMQATTSYQPTTQEVPSTTHVSTTQGTTMTSTTQQTTTLEQSTSTDTFTTENIPQQSTTYQTSTQVNQEQTTTSSTDQITNEITAGVESTSSTTQLTTTDMSSTTTTEFTEQTTATDQTTLQTSTNQQTTTDFSSTSTTENNQEVTTETISSANQQCPETEEDQSLYVCPTSFKRHPKYCNLFYQCIEDNDSYGMKIAVFNCPNNTIYDERKIQCVEESKSSAKCTGQIEQKNRVKRFGAVYDEPIIVSKESMRCVTSGHFPFEKHTECSSALLKCQFTKSGKLKGYVYKCPEGYMYWTISRRCEAIKNIKDCRGSSYPWNRRHDIPLERFNVAY